MPRYVLITAARNEGRYIGATLRSVLEQSILPARWVIVSDGSTDDTDEIVAGFARRTSFIRLLRLDDGASRSFASQAHGLNRAADALSGVPCAFIGCLDADITLPPRYYAEVLAEFAAHPALGICGGSIHERGPGGFRNRRGNSAEHVAGAVQMFRRACFRAIGPFVPLPNGGLDTVAELRAQMMGYRVASLPSLPVYHHRLTGGSDRPLAAAYKAGVMDHELGYHPLYELAVCARRAPWHPPFLGSLVRLAGFLGARAAGVPRRVGEDVVAHLRAGQKRRLRRFLPHGRAALVLLFLLAAALTAHAAEYFVDFQEGFDSRPGTSRDAAWKHAPGDPAARGFPASVRLSPGDIVTFRGGVAYHGALTIRRGGTSEKPLRYRGTSWGPGRAVIDGGGTLAGGFTVDASYLRIEGFEIRNMAQFGIWHDSPWIVSGVQIVNNRIHDIGPWPSASSPPVGNALYLRFVSDLLVERNEIFRTAGDACRVFDATNVTIRGNHLHDGQNDGIIGGAALSLVIDANAIHGFSNYVTHGDGMQIMRADVVRVSNNLLYDNTQDIYFDTYASAFNTCFVYNNVVYNTAAGSDGLSGFYNGIVVDNRFHSVGSLFVYQNTFVDLNNGSGAFRNLGTGEGALPIGIVSIMNNIFFNSLNRIDTTVILNFAMDYNTYYNEHRDFSLPGSLDLAAFRATYPTQEQHSVDGDPLLDAADGWSPRPGSSAIGSGTVLPNLLDVTFSRDRNGGARPAGSGWDMGAYQHGAAGAVPGSPSRLRLIP